MKTRIFFISLFILGLLAGNPAVAQKQNEEREVAVFSEISLRVPGKLYLEQGETQQVEIVAKPSVLKQISTEVKDRKLVIRFIGLDYLKQSFNPKDIEIYVTAPEIDGLSLSGSGDIVAESEIKTRILDLSVSGSGDLQIDKLAAGRVKANISGSGNIIVKGSGTADELSVSISGSGNVDAGGFDAKTVTVNTAGSGNCTVKSDGAIKARIVGSGNVYYKGNASFDSSVVGSGGVRKL